MIYTSSVSLPRRSPRWPWCRRRGRPCSAPPQCPARTHGPPPPRSSMDPGARGTRPWASPAGDLTTHRMLVTIPTDIWWPGTHHPCPAGCTPAPSRTRARWRPRAPWPPRTRACGLSRWAPCCTWRCRTSTWCWRRHGRDPGRSCRDEGTCRSYIPQPEQEKGKHFSGGTLKETNADLIGWAPVIIPNWQILDILRRFVQSFGFATQALSSSVNPNVKSLHSEKWNVTLFIFILKKIYFKSFEDTFVNSPSSLIKGEIFAEIRFLCNWHCCSFLQYQNPKLDCEMGWLRCGKISSVILSRSQSRK